MLCKDTKKRKIMTLILNINQCSIILLVILITSEHSVEHKEIRRQGISQMPDFTGLDPVQPSPPSKGSAGKMEKERFTKPTTTRRRFVRTTPMRISFEENCDYLAHYCLKAYDTGSLCGRTLYYVYHTFKNYCLLDYVNCMERYEVWQVVHMGECFNVSELTEYLLYPYDDDYFLDQYYVMVDH